MFAYTIVNTVMCICWNSVDLSKKFDSLAMLLPTNCYSTVCKLRKKPNFSDVDDAIGDKLLLECDNASIINKQLLSYLYKKCFNDLHVLYDILEQLVAADKLVQLLKYKTGKHNLQFRLLLW